MPGGISHGVKKWPAKSPPTLPANVAKTLPEEGCRSVADIKHDDKIRVIYSWFSA